MAAKKKSAKRVVKKAGEAAPKKKATKKAAKKAAVSAGAKGARGRAREGALRVDDVMKELEAAGTAQNRKVYARHGAGGRMFGVSFTHLRAMAKKIGKDQLLAKGLWKTGNHDARLLATMIADPSAMTRSELEAWAKQIDTAMLADSFAGLAAHTKHAIGLIAAWTASEAEYLCRCGYSMISMMLRDGLEYGREQAEPVLSTIEREIHDVANRTREGMNSALIAIGTYIDDLRDDAIEVARRIGRVDVDHGETGCKTPDAASYIKKAAAHRAGKKK